MDWVGREAEKDFRLAKIFKVTRSITQSLYLLGRSDKRKMQTVWHSETNDQTNIEYNESRLKGPQ